MNQFKVWRSNSGLTQAEVASKLGLKDKSAISQWETGAALPNAKLLPNIAQLYGCTIDDLLRHDAQQETALNPIVYPLRVKRGS